MAVYRPKFVQQWNDPTTTLDWNNCTMASGAMALDFDTLGKTQVLGGQLRAVSGDFVGGTGLGSPGLTQAWAKYGQTLHVESGKGWAEVIADLKAYKGVVLQGMYGSLTIYRSPLNSQGYTGPHAIYLNPEFDYAGRILMGDPLNNRFIWVPQSSLRAFAEALGKKEFGTTSKIFFATTDPHPVAAHNYSIYIAAGTTQIEYVQVEMLGRIFKWGKLPWSGKASSAPCNPPYTMKGYYSGSAMVAPVTAGEFVGKKVRITSQVTCK